MNIMRTLKLACTHMGSRHLSWFLTVWHAVAGRRQQSVAALHEHMQQPVQADAAPNVLVGVSGLIATLPSSGVHLLRVVSAHELSVA